MSHASISLNTDSIPACGLDRHSAITLATAAGDVVLIVDHEGVVRDVPTNNGADTISADSATWIGRPWVETVTRESRGEVEALLRDVAASGVSRRRQVNHPTAAGPDLPVEYTALRLSGTEGDIVAVGRDIRAITSLQQRLVETQQALECEYSRLRHVETRYRLLFQISSDAILVVDASNRRIVDANAAASRLFDKSTDKLVGCTFPIGVDPETEPALEEAFARARAAGCSGTVETRLANGRAAAEVSVSCFRQDAVSFFLVRFALTGVSGPRESESAGEVAELLENMPDGFVVTDMDGRISSANRSFLDQLQLADGQQAHGRLISEWVGRPGADLCAFLATLRKHRAVRLMATAVRGEQGSISEVEISAAAAPAAAPRRIGFIVRDVGRRVSHGPTGARDLTLAVEQLTSLVGRVALRDLLRDTSDLVERHFIEAALQLTGDNRTAAAEVLGLSRQSLYVKMRRHQPAAAGSLSILSKDSRAG
ncbi:MAG: transcriptional regulator PpsR [Gemmatimonadaceae bacterium]